MDSAYNFPLFLIWQSSKYGFSIKLTASFWERNYWSSLNSNCFLVSSWLLKAKSESPVRVKMTTLLHVKSGNLSRMQLWGTMGPSIFQKWWMKHMHQDVTDLIVTANHTWCVLSAGYSFVFQRRELLSTCANWVNYLNLLLPIESVTRLKMMKTKVHRIQYKVI